MAQPKLRLMKHWLLSTASSLLNTCEQSLRVVLVVLLIVVVGCTTQRLSLSSQLSPGMTMEQARGVMGNPVKTEFSGRYTAWHYCSTGFGSDRFVTLVFADEKLIETFNYTVTLAEGGYGDCSSFTRRVDFSKYQTYSSAQPRKEKPTVVSGTAWLLDSGYVVTNHHVIDGGSRFVLIGKDKAEIPMEVIAKDRHNDLALLRAKSLVNRQGLKLSTDRVSMGASVATMGFPHTDIMGSEAKLSVGIVNSTTGFQDDPRTYQVSVPVQSGNSGGPLVNEYGYVVGIVTAKLSAFTVFMWTGDMPENVNYAVKSSYLKILTDSHTGVDAGPPNASAKKSPEELAELMSGCVFQIISSSE